MIAQAGAVPRPAALYLPPRPAARPATSLCWRTIALIASRHRNLAFPLTLAAGALAGALTTSAIMGRQDSKPGTTALEPVRNETVVHWKVRRIALLTPSPKDHDQEHTVIREPFDLQLTEALPNEVSAKWADLQSRIRSEEETLTACRAGSSECPAAARRFLQIIELGRQHHGRARLGVVNRAVNLSIKPASDRAQYGVDDFWAAPLATLGAGAGDCEDYAIVKYVALREAGIVPSDLRLMIVRDTKRKTDHAVLAVRLGEEWLILDNRTLIMVSADDARQYYPLFVLDHRGVRVPEFASAAALRRGVL
jgi:predicted transglutaminase-like cysteine proteinase